MLVLNIVRYAHYRSRNECADPARLSNPDEGLDREAFARGMWRIDEELHRARILGVGRKSKNRSGPRVILR